MGAASQQVDGATDNFSMRPTEPSSLHDHIAYSTIGAAIEVHRHLGPGLPEATYEQALAFELEKRNFKVARQVPIALAYKGLAVGELRLDLLVEDLVLVELKSVDCFARTHFAQVLGYLRAAKLQLGLLINFNVAVLRDGIRRFINT